MMERNDTREETHMPFMEQMENVIVTVVTFMVHILEIMGAVIIIWGAIKSFIEMFAKRHTDVRLELAQFMALGLEFKLGGEILRTVIVRDLTEIAMVGAIIALRSLLNFLIHWEIQHIKHDGDEFALSMQPSLFPRLGKKKEEKAEK